MNGNSNLQVGYFFPTAIGVCTDLLEMTSLDSLHVACSNLQTTTLNSSNSSWLSGDQSPYNTMTTHNIAEDTNFAALQVAVDTKVREFALHHADNGNYTCDHAWLNVYGTNQYQEPHTHSAPYIYSAVFYVDADDDAGLFVAQAPFCHVQVESNHVGQNILTDTKRWFQPQPNMLIMFKSSLSHYTTPNRGTRTSVAFNYKPS